MIETPKFEDGGWTDATVALLCPKCKNPHLHQYTVETFHRGEDETKLIHTSAYMDGTEVVVRPSAAVSNPSSRRHGLTIHFECEHCHHEGEDAFHLNIWQHKGTTYMHWLVPDDVGQ